MNYWLLFMRFSEDERHHESDESDEWKKEGTGESKISRLQSFLRIRWIRGAFTLSIFEKWLRLFPRPSW